MKTKNNKNKKRGLILLVVLGMLTLFSLLTVTFVLVSSQSRSTNVAFSRRMVRETETRPMFNDAVHQLLRGTTDPNSAMFGQDLLADLYGANEASTLSSQMLSIRRNGMTWFPDNFQRPMLLGGSTATGARRFLKIPIDRASATGVLATLLDENDALTGRIITFPEGQGPLGGESFRVIRHVGDMTAGINPQHIRESSFSITIDLNEANLGREYTRTIPNSGATETLTLAEWADKFPTEPQTNPVPGGWASGIYLCYNKIFTDSSRILGSPYQFYVSAVPLNSHGVGIQADGSSQVHRLDDTPSGPLSGSSINDMSVGLIPNARLLGNAPFGSLYNQLLDSNGSRSPRINNDPALKQILRGDTDEPLDAADYNSMFLSHRDADSGEIIPSFHRAELINYIVNFKPLDQYTEWEFWAVIRRIELAMLRPLSLNIITPSPPPPFMNFSGPGNFKRNPQFNAGDIGTLNIEVRGSADQWATNWPDQGRPAFVEWLNRLTGRVTVGGDTRVTWDVDNLGTGVPDSIWMDLGLPLQRTADGKLLKSLVAYYIEDLDGKLDINATGSIAQANMNINSSRSNVTLGVYNARPTHRPPSTAASAISPYALGPGTTTQSMYLHQGLGYGPADISFRHLLGKNGLQFRLPNGTSGSGQAYAEVAYRELMQARYQPNPSYTTNLPGSELGHDAISKLNLRETLYVHRHGSLPGLPMGVRGRVSLTMDRLGNPILHNYDNVITPEMTEYAARLVSAPHQDSPFTIAEWERIYRVADADHSDLPDRLQKLLGETEQTLPLSSIRREITPISRSMRVPLLGGRSSIATANNPQSFLQLINTVRQLKGQTPITNPSHYEQLFPLEFRRGAAMNLNRPFGNGTDDNNNEQIDEAIEIAAGSIATNVTVERAWEATSSSGITTTNNRLDYLQGGNELDATLESAVSELNPINDAKRIYLGQQSRQLFARHLYCLAQLLIPEEYVFPNIDRAYWKDILDRRTGVSRNKYNEIRGRILAQWAVNVVDFRDSDAAMTRFPYDETPFDPMDGWTPNKVVWGMEQPELLLTESLALHDLRIREAESSNPRRFDQFRMPQGSLFLELYAPRTTETGTGAAASFQVPGVPTSLYRTNAAGDVVLDVSRLTPSNVPGFPGTYTQFPVWRVYISNPERKAALTQNLKSPNERLTAPAATTLNDATRFDLSLQLARSNILDPSGSNWSDPSWVAEQERKNAEIGGLRFDFADNAQRLREPDQAQSRIILFTRSGFVPSLLNCPGVDKPDRQVFYNRSQDILLRGNQYLVVGPREETFLGSRTASRASPPVNNPSRQKIVLDDTARWVRAYQDDNTPQGREFRTIGQNVNQVVTMVAAANQPAGWTPLPPPDGPTIDVVGISVSEPLPTSSYYAQPTKRINSDDNGPGDNSHDGFAENQMFADGYFDYKDGPRPSGYAPFDRGNQTGTPLRQWTQNKDPAGQALTTMTLGSDQVVRPGTAVDWCTAYLQRLADPDKPWHALFNPYITVDWIPIDLTVFSGEENDSQLDPTGELYLASRQKSGQMIEANSGGSGLEFNPSGTPGHTFLSTLTHGPRRSTKPTTPPTFLEFELAGDQGVGSSPRPSKCISGNRNFQAEDAGTEPAFSTLGFLNSTYVLAAERTPAPHALPPVYAGAPGKPDTSSDFDWHPATVFWPNRLFVNRMELAYVPLSSPGQLGQEFTATSSGGTGPLARAFESAFQGANNARPTSPAVGTPNSNAQYPYAHLLNFFQEMPELTNPVIIGGGPRHSKDTGPAMLLELLETPSPWADVEGYAPPSRFAETTGGGDWTGVVNVHNFIMAPLRAPYNKIPLHAEPGKVNLNTVSSPEVLQGLFSNMLEPSDIDFAPFDPTPPFGSNPEDIDHNADGVRQGGARAEPGQAATLWTSFKNSRMGYALGGGGNYVPVSGGTRGFDPRFPTRFAGAFKPIWEAGMVPKTRNPLPSGDPNYNLVQQYGMLDMHSRLRPGYATVMRPQDPTATPLVPLFPNGFPTTRTYSQRHPVNDLYPISRLQNLVTERSNVFAVYATVGLFEYDEANNSIGAEYGRETGENKRLKSFYVIDRSIPVAYRPGEDTNVEKLILIKRILSE